MRIKEFDNYSEACDYLRENELDSAVVQVGDEYTLLKPTGEHRFVHWEDGKMVIEELEKLKEKTEEKPRRNKGAGKIRNPKMPSMKAKEKDMDMQDVEVEVQNEEVQEAAESPVSDVKQEDGSKDGRGRKKGSGVKDKQVLQALEKFEEASSKQLAEKTGIAQAYVSVILKKNARVARKEGRTIIYTL